MPSCLLPLSTRFSVWTGRMGLLLALVAAVATLPPAARAQTAPKAVSVQELCLLLHGGYTGDETLRETAGRPLLTPLDEAAEKTLRAAGADDRFLDALRTGRRTLTDAEAADARQQQAQIDARNTEGKAAYMGRMAEANKQAFQAHLAARKEQALGQLAARLRGKLVALRGGQLQPCADDVVAGKKVFAFYLVAGRSPAGREFTPKLVKFYQDFAPKHAVFEVVLVSQDRSATEMENTVRQTGMPWPALAYGRRGETPELLKLAQGDVPRLILYDGAGRVMSDSFVEDKYVGPQHVLDDLTRWAAGGGG